MTDRELQKLKRVELLQLLVEQSRELDALRRELEETKKQLADRELHMQEAGSIAEASMQLNGVFEAAQRAADQCLSMWRKSAPLWRRPPACAASRWSRRPRPRFSRHRRIPTSAGAM